MLCYHIADYVIAYRLPMVASYQSAAARLEPNTYICQHNLKIIWFAILVASYRMIGQIY